MRVRILWGDATYGRQTIVNARLLRRFGSFRLLLAPDALPPYVTRDPGSPDKSASPTGLCSVTAGSGGDERTVRAPTSRLTEEIAG